MPTVLTAATASMTLPGPTGSPAARNVRAKCIRLASSRPLGSGMAVAAPHPPAARVPPSPRMRGEGWGEGPVAACPGGLGLHLIEDAGGFAAVQAGDVVLVFEQHAQGVVDRVRRQLEYVELHQGFGPVDRLGDAGKLEEIHRAQPLHKADDLARQVLARARAPYASGSRAHVPQSGSLPSNRSTAALARRGFRGCGSR